MNPALWIAKTGLEAQQTKMNVIANNLANVNTTGFKKGRASFESLIYQNIRQPGAQSTQNTQLPSGLMLGTGVKVGSTEKIFTQGNITQTGNNLDMAIQGQGFFQILMPDGSTAYTRDGQFQLNSNGEVVTSNGYPLQPAITIPPNTTSITIGSDGTVSVTTNGSTTPSVIGTIQLANFINPAGLQPLGNNLFAQTASSGTAQAATPGLNGLGTLDQGALESSNVNTVESLVNMIQTQQAYQINSKAISTVNQMLQYVDNNL